jgi:hypothetical protein
MTRKIKNSNITPGALTSASLNDTGVIAGEYGSSTAIPVITTNAKGQLTAVTTASLPSNLATETYVTTAISNLIDSAPTTLDTLNELSAALNDDANFASTVTTALGTKANTSDVNSALALKADTSSLSTLATISPTGTPDSTKFLRGDNSWQVVAVTPTAVSDQNNTSTGYFDLPSGTTAQRPASPQVGYTRYNTTNSKPEVYTSSGWASLDIIPEIVATGGDITTLGGYKYHTFTSSGTFQVTSGSGSVSYFIVAGGGGGGRGNSGGNEAGGGGAGGLIQGSQNISVASYSIIIGGGGGSETQGSNSSAFSQTAIGGGRGASGGGSAGSGGSGGGGAHNQTSGGSGTTGQGNSGGTPNTGSRGGGGGGAGAPGASVGPGGSGLIPTIATTFYAGGGAGCVPGATQSGGAGGGGSSPGSYGNGGNGTTNTGGGGGGNYDPGSSYVGGSGGSGIVVIRYQV